MNIIIAIILASTTFIFRLVEHPANIAPTAAAMLFAGAILPRRWAIFVPLAGSVAADFFLERYDWHLMFAVYGSFLLIGGIGMLIGRGIKSKKLRLKNIGNIALGSLSGSILFFLVTNWAVWVWTPMYSPTLSGLWASYVMGIPFFKNTLLGDLLFSSVFFGAYAVALWTVTHRKQLFSHKVMMRDKYL